MTAAGQVRSEIVSRLKAAGLDAAEAVSEALLDGLADGLTLDELSWEKTEWDEEYGMFVRRGTARCTAYFVATADEESAVLTDFILKGVMQ